MTLTLFMTIQIFEIAENFEQHCVSSRRICSNLCLEYVYDP